MMITRKIDPRKMLAPPEPEAPAVAPVANEPDAEEADNTHLGLRVLIMAPLLVPFYVGVAARIVHWMLAGF